MKYDELSRQIADLVGGVDNIDTFTSCMTRLRLNVDDPEAVDVEALRKLDGVLGVVPGRQVQVVVGPGHAQRLREAFAEASGMSPRRRSTPTTPRGQRMTSTCATSPAKRRPR